eukprot:scaffold4863_cov158-Pinguiococcus_pyrenoidosus.AAC.1
MAVAKVVLVGPPWAGKTSMVHCLKTGQFLKDRTMTDGIIVTPLEVSAGDDTIEFLFYDLGGQEAYQTTHQFFLRTRAVFVVVWNPESLEERLTSDRCRVHKYARDVLDSAPEARMLFVTTRKDLGVREIGSEEQAFLAERYEDHFAGYSHVTCTSARDLNVVQTGLIDTASSLSDMDRVVPQSYKRLRDRLRQLREEENAPLTISREEWNQEARAAGLSDSDAIEQALELFHLFGDIMRLPSEGREDVVISPERLGDVLSCVITADPAKAKNSRGGLLRHDEIGQVWKDYPAHLHRGFLQLLEDSKLAYPLRTEEDGDLGASLILPMLRQSTTRRDAIFRDFRETYPELQAVGTVTLFLSSFPSRLFTQVLFNLWSMTESDSWSRSACVVVQKAKSSHRGPEEVIAYASVTARQESFATITLDCFGSSVLVVRALHAIKAALKPFPGVGIRGFEAPCRAGALERLQLKDIKNLDAGVDARGAPFALDVLHALGLGSDTSPQSPPLQKQPSFSEVVDAAEIKHCLRKLKEGASKEEMELIVLLSLEKLCKVGVKDGRRLDLNALWLVYRRGEGTPASGSSAWRAAPLCPQVAADWKVDDHMTVVLAQYSEKEGLHRLLNDLIAQLLDKLEVLAPEHDDVFHGVLWECAETQKAHEIVKASRAFKLVRGFEQPLRVHKDDYPDFRFDQLEITFRENMERVLRDMRLLREDISSQIQAVRELQMEKSCKIQRMLMTLVKGAKNSGQLPPRFVWVFPVKQERSLVRPSSWFQDKLCIKCLCDVSLKEGDGEGFVVERPREFVRRCLPYIRFSLTVLRVAFATGRLAGFPLPLLDDVSRAIGAERRQALSELLEALDGLADVPDEGKSDGKPEDTFEELVSTSHPDGAEVGDPDSLDEEMLQKLRQVSEEHFHAMRGFLDDTFPGWQRRCGLEFIKADDDTFAWVHHSMIAKYREEGAKALRSLSKDQGSSVTSVREEVKVEEARAAGREVASQAYYHARGGELRAQSPSEAKGTGCCMIA